MGGLTQGRGVIMLCKLITKYVALQDTRSNNTRPSPVVPEKAHNTILDLRPRYARPPGYGLTDLI